MSAGAGKPWYPHVDGLRAIAVLAVIAYHLEPAWVPGGFTGVDVFFVISGYVVSASLAGAGGKSLPSFALDFYVRRLRRIAPALVACLLATGVASALFVPHSWLSQTSERTGLMAFIGLSNFVLAASEGDYFSPRTEFNPYAHTWSLGVEEQFYLSFPLLFWGWTRARRGRTASATLIGVAGIASLACAATWASTEAQTAAFYLLPSRFWQLAAGVLLYQWLVRERGSLDSAGHVRASDARATGGWSAASLLLLLAGLVLARPGRTPWPDGVLPVLGTLGVLAALHGSGAGGRDGGWSSRWLSSRPMASIGRVSYSLYLWHWPVFVLFRWTVGLGDWPQQVSALAATSVLAVASYRLVERPLRYARRQRHLPRPLFIALGFGAVLVSGWGFHQIDKRHAALSLSVVTRDAEDWYPAPRRESAVEDCAVHFESTRQGPRVRWRWRRGACSHSPAGSRRVFVVGDSHALAYAVLLSDHARRTGDEVRLWHRTGCAFVGLLRAPADEPAECAAATTAWVAELERETRAGDVLFLPSLRLPRLSEQWDGSAGVAVRAAPLDAAARADVERAAIALLAPLAARGVHIVFEAPKPVLRAPAYRCVDWFNRSNPACAGGLAIERDEIEAMRLPVLESFARIGAALDTVSVWDPLPTLCPASRCRAESGSRPLFFDGDHLSGYANRLLAPEFAAHLAARAAAALTSAAHPGHAPSGDAAPPVVR